MLAKIKSFSIDGMECHGIDVEVGISGGLPKTTIVGLGDAAVQEAKERVRLAMLKSGYEFPNGKLTVNLAPADLRKSGANFDLPIALGLMMASGQVLADVPVESAFVGELALDGNVRHVNGIIAMATTCGKLGIKNIFVPKCDAVEAALVPDVNVFGVSSLKELVEHISGEKNIKMQDETNPMDLMQDADYVEDMAFIKGQEHAKRALEISAAGSHNILMNGSPGSGKTLLAKTFSTILPDMTIEESLDVTKIYSIAGLLDKNTPLVMRRPYRAVHHTASSVSIVGGGSNPAPGEISLAHKGVLFLDEIAEFPSSVLEVLRQPLEDHTITVSRATGTHTFPAQFVLLAAMNPCPCGFYNVPNSPKPCICSSGEITRYQKKISGPLLDRIDLYVDVPPVEFDKLTNETYGERSVDIRSRVQRARDVQTQRFAGLGISSNAEMSGEQVKRFCGLTESQKEFMKMSMRQLRLSARGFHRILKISRTIADLEGSENLLDHHLAEALQYRPKITE